MSVLSLWVRLGSCKVRRGSHPGIAAGVNPTLEFPRDRGSCLSMAVSLLLILLAHKPEESTPKLDQRVYLEHKRQNLATPAAKAIYS